MRMPRSKSLAAIPAKQKKKGFPRTSGPPFRCIFAPPKLQRMKKKPDNWFSDSSEAGLLLAGPEAVAQCSICTKTAQQLGEGPAKGMNTGIPAWLFAPMAIIGFFSLSLDKK